MSEIRILEPHEIAESVSLDTYERIDGKRRILISNIDEYTDGSWYHWSINDYKQAHGHSQGVWEEKSCGRPKEDENTFEGSHVFYNANGDVCCMEIKTIGPNRIFKLIFAPIIRSESLCKGGVFRLNNIEDSDK